MILGGGRRHFLSKVSATSSGAEGRRLDGRNLIDDWLRDKKHRDLSAEYVVTRQQLRAIDSRFVDYLFGNYKFLFVLKLFINKLSIQFNLLYLII